VRKLHATNRRKEGMMKEWREGMEATFWHGVS
jgi:hypothetical protein